MTHRHAKHAQADVLHHVSSCVYACVRGTHTGMPAVMCVCTPGRPSIVNKINKFYIIFLTPM